MQLCQHLVYDLHHLFDCCHFTLKLVLRHFMAVGNNLPAGFQSIDDSRSHGDREQLGILKVIVALHDALIHAVYCHLFVRHGIARMEVKTVPHAVLHEQVLTSHRLIVDESVDGACNAHGVKECPHRIDRGMDKCPVHFAADVSVADGQQLMAKVSTDNYSASGRTSSSEQETGKTQYSNDIKVDVKVVATSSDMPMGVAKLLQVMQQFIQQKEIEPEDNSTEQSTQD